MTDEEFRLVVRTFASVFPDATLRSLYPGRDVLLLGSLRPLEIDPAALRKGFARPGVAERLKAVGIGGPTALLALQTAADARVRAIAGRGRIHEDRFPILDYAAPKALFLDTVSFIPEAYDSRFKDAGLLLARLLARRGRPLSREELSDLAAYDRRFGTRLADRARLDRAR
jgi:hypothetical protein